jgi:phosphatidylglycerophosphate synthase
VIDAKLRRYVDPPLDRLASTLSKSPITANEVTLAGFFVGMAAVPALAFEQFSLALALVLANRFFDGLDGAVARQHGVTDLGGYLDIVLDFIFYSAVIFGFVLVDPANALWGAFLIFAFIGTGTTFLTYSVFAAKHDIKTDIRGRKSIYYLGGLTEGFETIVALSLMCVFPAWFWLIALVFGSMCWVTTATRIAWAWQTLKDL